MKSIILNIVSKLLRKKSVKSKEPEKSFSHRDNLKKWIKTNEGIKFDDLQYIDPRLLSVIAELNLFCARHGENLVITSIVRSPKQDEILGAKSTTHSSGRAVDVSIRYWKPGFAFKVSKHLNKMFSNIGAIGASSGERKLVVIHNNHDGKGKHMHIQVDFSMVQR